MARAAAARGVAMGLSSFASKSIEDVAAVNDKTFFQMYWVGSREVLVQRMERSPCSLGKGPDHDPRLVVLQRT